MPVGSGGGGGGGSEWRQQVGASVPLHVMLLNTRAGCSHTWGGAGLANWLEKGVPGEDVSELLLGIWAVARKF